MHEGLPEPGDIIAGKYVVERALGRGGMGAVYSVSHQLTGKRLALKCLLPQHANNPNVVERFLREARAAGRIQHRHVIDVFDVGRDDALLYIVMPLLEGKPLGELFRDERLTLEEALVVLVRAMEGVAAANSVGILHRDLKPGNIFVCVGPSGKLDDPRVLDFGISKVDDELESPLTRSGVAVGTPYYMALEQLTGQRDVDQRVDVYAMGVILYEAVIGDPPHTADNVAALAIRLMHTPPLHLRVARPDLPPGLADAIMRAIARDREERFFDIRALIDAITPFIPESASLHAAELDRRPLRTPREMTRRELATEMARASQPTEPRKVHAFGATLQVSKPATLPARSSQPHDAGRRGRATMVAGGAALVLTFVVAFGAFSAAPEPEARDRPVAVHAAMPDAGLAPLVVAANASPVAARLEDASVVTTELRVVRKPPVRRLKKQLEAPAPVVAPPVAAPLPPREVIEPSNTRAGSLAPEEF